MSISAMNAEGSGWPGSHVPSLASLAKRACIRNIRAIIDVGDASYEQVRSVLLKVPDPERLHLIETNSPQIQGATGELWRTLIKRDVEKYASTYDVPEPEDPCAWYELYHELRREQDAKLRRNVKLLSAKLQGIKDEAALHTSRQVSNSSLPKLPRAAGMRVEKRPSTTAPRVADPSRLHFGGGSRTKTVSGTDVLNRARREAREMSVFRPRGSNSNLARPTHQLSARATLPVKAPLSMSRAGAPGSSGTPLIRPPRNRSAGQHTAPARLASSAGASAASRGPGASRNAPENTPPRSRNQSGSRETSKRSASISSESLHSEDGDAFPRRIAKVPRISPAAPAQRKPKKEPTLFMANKKKPKPKAK